MTNKLNGSLNSILGRREEERYSANLALRVADPNMNTIIDTKIFNLSKSGIRFPLKSSLKCDDLYSIEIDLPSNKKFKTKINLLGIKREIDSFIHRGIFINKDHNPNLYEFLSSINKNKFLNERRQSFRPNIGPSDLNSFYRLDKNSSITGNNTETITNLLIQTVNKFIYLASHAPKNEIIHYHKTVSLVHELCASITLCEIAGIERKIIEEIISDAKKIHSNSPFINRLQNWPRGYPGDFETIDYLVAQKNHLEKPNIEYYLEEFALGSTIAQQHRNKVSHQGHLILETILNHPVNISNLRSSNYDIPTILIIACGSSPDIAQIINFISPYNFKIVFNDIEYEAIKKTVDLTKTISAKSKYFYGNIFTSLSKISHEGRYDLIVAGGLFDYLSNRQAQFLIKKSFERLLKPNGKFLFTNIAKGNPYKPWIEYLANWKLIERDENDILNLVKEVGLGTENIRFSKDSTRLTYYTLLQNSPILLGSNEPISTKRQLKKQETSSENLR